MSQVSNKFKSNLEANKAKHKLSDVHIKHINYNGHNIISLQAAYSRSYKRFYLSSQKYSKSPRARVTLCPFLAEPEIILSPPERE